MKHVGVLPTYFTYMLPAETEYVSGSRASNLSAWRGNYYLQHSKEVYEAFFGSYFSILSIFKTELRLWNFMNACRSADQHLASGVLDGDLRFMIVKMTSETESVRLFKVIKHITYQ